jgi:hypothetical protein
MIKKSSIEIENETRLAAMATADGFETEDLFFGVGALCFFGVNILLPSRIAEIRLPSSMVCNC